MCGARTRGTASRSKSACSCFSDGQDVGSWTPPERVLELARESEAVVRAVEHTDGKIYERHGYQHRGGG